MRHSLTVVIVAETVVAIAMWIAIVSWPPRSRVHTADPQASASRATPPPVDRGATRAAAPGPSAESVACANLTYDPEAVETPDPPTLCGYYRDEFLPAVAMATIRCMQAARWSICDVSPCARTALASVPPENDTRCTRVEQRCSGMGALCRTYIAGMKPAGRERFAACLVEHCGLGLRFCLWDPAVSPCDVNKAS